jgi:Cu(I)/Ag(I) efflux system protein CusF
MRLQGVAMMDRPTARPPGKWATMVLAWALGLAAMAAYMPAWAQQGTATGEVRRIDAQQGTVALRHGEIKALGLPAATLVYRAAPALLRDIKPGDKVRFTAARQDGKYVLTAIDKTMLP